VDQLILFTDANFQGAHKHIFDKADALSLLGTDSDGNTVCVANCEFPDGVSSIVILSGNWQFFQDENLANPFPGVVIGPGLYRFVGEKKLSNDKIRSMMTVPDEPTMPGEPLNGHVILFEHANFRGEHQHLFEAQKDLGAVAFDKKTSSIVVESGNWSFYFDTEFDGSYPLQPIFGPGIYPWVEGVGISNDSVSSLQPSTSAATISNSVDNEVILFQYGAFYGPHRHVFAPEPNLNADDDNFFNDNVGSLVILTGAWSFYADWNFHGLYDSGPVGLGTYPDLSTLSIDYHDVSSLRPTVPAAVTLGTTIFGHVILFKDANFQGPHKHVLNAEDNLNADDDNEFNDSVSSIVVLAGNWKFYRNSGFDDDYPVVLGPGLYPWVEDLSIRDNDMSSLQVVEDRPTTLGDPVAGHIVLFEHDQFRGGHKHIFRTEDLGPDADKSFNTITSSLVVLLGTWNLGTVSGVFGWAGIGEGLYWSITDVKNENGESLPNDALTSLELTDSTALVFGEPKLGSVILFENKGLRGAHKHVFNWEENLNADEDNTFNDATLSIAVLEGTWSTYRDANLWRAYDVTLGKGLFPWVENVGIANDDMSSLSVAGEKWQLTGTATIQIASGAHPNPYIEPVTMTFLVPSNSQQLLVAKPFDPIDTDLGTVTYVDSRGGTFATDGQIIIPEFSIQASKLHASLSDTFILSTGSTTSPQNHFNKTGSPVAADGKVTLVGSGHMSGFGGAVDDDFLVVIDGTFLRQT